MKFNKSLDWLKESDEENLLGDDELDVVDEELNEGLYVDPANYDKHSDLVDVVDKAGNPQKMTQATYNKNKGSGEFKDAEPKEEPKEKEQDKSKVSKASITDLPKEVSTKQLNDILQKDLNIQNKEFAKDGKLTEQELSKVKETLDNGNGIMAHLEFWDDRGYLSEIIGVYQKGKDGKIYRSAYQNYSGTWIRDEEDDAEYTSDNFDEFSSEVLDSLAEDRNCKLMY